jgi:hypothetical protein
MVDNTLTELCQDLRNWFDRARYIGNITLDADGGVFCNGVAIGLAEGQYFRVIGSVFADGVHVYPDTETTAESFTGVVWAMAVPPDFLSLVQEIEDWNTNARPKMLGPYSSENLSSSGYSYQRQSAEDMAKADYKTVFGARLNKWRKL